MDILKNKKYKAYDRISRYTRFPVYYNTVDNKYVYGTTAQLRDDSVFSLHKVAHGDTLDTISLKYYNNPTYYWVIADFNRIQDPFEDLTVGIYLKIPTLSVIQFNM